MIINNYKSMNYLTWGLISFLVVLISISFIGSISAEMKILSLLLSLGLSVLFIHIEIIEYRTSLHSIIIRKTHPFRFYNMKNELIKIQKEHLKMYSLNENLFDYDLLLIEKNENGKERTTKIKIRGFSWKLMIRMIKSLENAKRTNQFA